jgi:RNA polymerase sigma-70 factor (ECF subfamily)
MNEAFVYGPWALNASAAVTESKAQNAEATARMTPEGTAARVAEISRLFREHNAALIKFVLTKVGSEQEAKDVAQEAYVRLLQLDRPVAVRYLRWYLFRIARNIAADHYRHLRVRARISELEALEGLDASSPTESSAIAADQLATLLSALKELSGSCQKAFFLHKFTGLSTAEVAKCMHITDRMVRHHVRRALLYCRFRCDGLPKEEALHLAAS